MYQGSLNNDPGKEVLLVNPVATSLLDDESEEKQKKDDQKRRYLGIVALIIVLILVLISLWFNLMTNDEGCFTWEDRYYCPGDCIEQDHSLPTLYCPAEGEEPSLRYSLTVNTEAKCNDGTVPAFLYRKASLGGENNWMFRLEGGDMCNSVNSCLDRAEDTHFLSSNKVLPIVYQDGAKGGLVSGDPVKNPEYWNWHTIQPHYCSSDCYVGNAEPDDNDLGWYFRGFENTMGVFQEVVAQGWGIENADTILLNGFSAGGQGLILNSEPIRDYLAEVAPHANVVFLSDSGYFIESFPPMNASSFPCTNDKDECTFNLQMQMAYDLWKPGSLPESCLNAQSGEDAWKVFCFLLSLAIFSCANYFLYLLFYKYSLLQTLTTFPNHSNVMCNL